MRTFAEAPIRRQIVTVALLMILLLIMAVMWDVSRTRLERANEVNEQAEAIATTAAAALDQFFTSLDAMASVLVDMGEVTTFDADECNRLFEAILRDQPLLLNINLRDRTGTVRAAGAGLVEGQARQAEALPYIGEILQTGRPVVSQITIGQRTGRPIVMQGYPISGDDGSVIGVVSFALDLLELQRVFERSSLPERSVVTLVDRQSRILVRSVEGERFIGTPFDIQAVEPREVPRTFTRTGTDGISRFHANAVVNRGPWLLSVGIPQDVVEARLLSLWRRDLAIGLSAIGGVLLLMLWLAHHTSRGLEGLRSSAQRIAGGDLSPPVRGPAPNLEITQLQDAFITMAANLREARAALDRQIEEERKMREMLRSLQRQVVRQERLAAVGVLVSGVAHELNNPLQAILSVAELMERREGLDAALLDDIALLKTQSSRARETIRSLSRFSRQQAGPPSLVDLAEVSAEVVQLRRRDLEQAGISLDVEQSTGRYVYANATELEQVLLAFIMNAEQAIESTGRKAGRILVHLGETGSHVRLEVDDDGPGVAPECEPKLFQPFFTTKPVGKGTGLGLSVSYGIIESYGGTIGYRRNDWGGATFFFELPIAELQDYRIAGLQAVKST